MTTQVIKRMEPPFAGVTKTEMLIWELSQDLAFDM